MANINTKVINIARLSPVSKISPTNTLNTINGKAVADYVGEGGGGDSKQIESIINERFEKMKQFIDDTYLKGKVVTPDELPPVDERVDDVNYFVIPNEEA